MRNEQIVYSAFDVELSDDCKKNPVNYANASTPGASAPKTRGAERCLAYRSSNGQDE